MNIAQFTSSLIEPLGGAEQYCLTLARHQKSEGHEVTVVTGWADDSVVADLAAEGIRTVVLESNRPYPPDRHGGSLAQKLEFHGRELIDSLQRTSATRYLETAGFDVVHVHRYAGFGTAVLRARGVRIVHTAHDFTLVDTSASLVRDGVLMERPTFVQRVRGAFARHGLAPETTLIFPSERTRDRHSEWGFAVEHFDSIVIPHGWPVAQTEPEPSGTPEGDQAGDLTVLFLGKLSDHKGIPTLLDAWGAGIPGVSLRVGGDGPMSAEIGAVSTITALGWLGERERAEEFARADVLVFPSQWPENFPIVVAESMLAGVPVLTTEVASPPLVEDGESGLLVGPTAAELRAAIVRLSNDRALVARLSLGAHLKARQLDMTAHGEAIMDAYLWRATAVPLAERSASMKAIR
ncbi:hypothetical protein BH09ACT1_BH09ACT1_08010 [soil metagenome]